MNFAVFPRKAALIMPKSKKQDIEGMEADELLTQLLIFRQSVGWRYFEKQVKAFREQTMLELTTSTDPAKDAILKGEFTAYGRCLNLINKAIEDLTRGAPEAPKLDPY